MRLTTGTRLGPYEIVAPLGAGGMGEVYRARDPKLHRDVALKILPALFTADRERLARFAREAQALAALQHPNIATIFGLEEAHGTPAIAMELVEGPTLAERIADGPLPIDEALHIARQIADALDAAHEKGIIHRDLKPANIKLTADGLVKVLDFGLAKATAVDRLGDPAQSPTFTRLPHGFDEAGGSTQLGVIVGTAAYMAPEQARGKVVDKRADIWASGCVLYEMLTGRPPFAGETVTDILARVVEREPEWTTLPAATPPRVRELLRRCLQKDPKQRLRDIGDARILLHDPVIASGDEQGVALRVRRFSLPWVLAAVLGIALVVAIAAPRGSNATAAPLRRFTIELPSHAAPNWTDFDVAVSPDGARIAYNCRSANAVSICVRALDSLDVRPVADARDAFEWFFSPDGEWIALYDGVALSKVSIRGGEPQLLHRWLDTEPAPSGFSWGPDNQILFGTASGVRRISGAGGPVEQITTVAQGTGVTGHLRPSHLPDGRRALVTVERADGTGTCGVLDVNGASIRDLGVAAAGCMYVPDGWLAFKQGTTLHAVRFDPDNTGALDGAVPVIENVNSMPRLARDGTLVYVPVRDTSTARLVWVDRQGRATAVAAEPHDYSHLDLAPDGQQALLNDQAGAIYVVDLERGTRTLLGTGAFPIWSRDGKRVTFGGANGLRWQTADGSGSDELLLDRPGLVVPTSWHPVTGELAYYDHRAFEISVLQADGRSRRFLSGPGRKRSGRFSPDGRWMAYVSDETGDYQVYVTAYPGPGPTVAVSLNGGLSPVWSADGRELFFRRGGQLLAARVSATSPLRFEVPVELFDGPFTLDLMGHQREDVAPDGTRFLMVENSDDFRLAIVQNWPAELARLAR